METTSLIEQAIGREFFSSRPLVLGQFKAYHSLLLEWNKKMNLVSGKDEVRLVTRHFLESAGFVFAVDFPFQSTVLDLGSGAGFPGIPMKLLRPDLRLLLVESNQKRSAFLKEVVNALELEEAIVIQGRAEECTLKLNSGDSVVSRAVAELDRLLRWSLPFFPKGGGRLVALKGGGVYREIERIRQKERVDGIREFRVAAYNPFPTIFRLTNSYLVTVEF